jgi:chaperone BCS1
MTTNYPEKLDSALIRPGRVDLQTKFTLATHEQIRAIFTRMYSTDNGVKENQKKEGDGEHTCKDCTHCSTKHGKSSSIAVELAPEKLAELAEKFAQDLPDVTLSPAEIQGYLLMKKTDPDGAVAGAKEWKDKVLEAKKKGKKVVD